MKPCKRGHIAERDQYGNCRQCARDRAAAWRLSHPSYHKTYKRPSPEADKEYHRKRSKQRYARLRAEGGEAWERWTRQNREAHKRYAENNKDKIRQGQSRYYQKNAARLVERAVAWGKANPDARRRIREKLYSSNLNHRIRMALRSRLRCAAKRSYKSGSAIADLGCSIPEFRAHIESLFVAGMSWSNWGYRGWHIDHKRALATFDLTDPEQVRQACHYTNLQPLWALDNIRKGAQNDGVISLTAPRRQRTTPEKSVDVRAVTSTSP